LQNAVNHLPYRLNAGNINYSERDFFEIVSLVERLEMKYHLGEETTLGANNS
jgi:hypothetical protein